MKMKHRDDLLAWIKRYFIPKLLQLNDSNDNLIPQHTSNTYFSNIIFCTNEKISHAYCRS